eukprot:8536554-Heterocapsa_arctica.AAC.1
MRLSFAGLERRLVCGTVVHMVMDPAIVWFARNATLLRRAIMIIAILDTIPEVADQHFRSLDSLPPW